MFEPLEKASFSIFFESVLTTNQLTARKQQTSGSTGPVVFLTLQGSL